MSLQTWSHFEVLLINDGSTDESGVICEEYADKDHRFKVIHKQNEGVSAARQTGIEAASGIYVIHADADDWVESEMLQDLYAKAVSTHADVIFCDYYVESMVIVYIESKNLLLLILKRYFAPCSSSCTAAAVTSSYDELVTVNMDVIFQKGSTIVKIFFFGYNYCNIRK